jgi:drug/metabolite transporter (DMT)-like permease
MNMKKKILALIACAIVLSFIGAGFVSAADNLDGCKITRISRLPTTLNCQTTAQGDGTVVCMYKDADCGMCCLLNGIYNITDWVFVVLMAVSSLMIIWGAVLFTISSGDPEKTTNARNLIIFAAVGIAVALFSRAIPPAVKMIIGA